MQAPSSTGKKKIHYFILSYIFFLRVLFYSRLIPIPEIPIVGGQFLIKASNWKLCLAFRLLEMSLPQVKGLYQVANCNQESA